MPDDERFEPGELIGTVLADGADDWVLLLRIVNVARRTGVTDPEALRAMTLGLIGELLARDLMVPGDVGQLGFQAWPGSPGDWLRRIVETWDPSDTFPDPGSVCWFKNTDEGDRVGAPALERARQRARRMGNKRNPLTTPEPGPEYDPPA